MEMPAPKESDSGKGESAELKAGQVKALSALYEATAQQQKLLEAMLVQQKAQTEWLISIAGSIFPEPERYPGRQWVNVKDFNMPFWALVGFLVKMTLASIPAIIIFFGVILAIGAAFLALFSGLGSLLIGILSGGGG